MIDFQAISSSCVKCAKCVPQCTIYRIRREEVTSPRGYLDLIGAYSRGELSLDKNLKDFVESCFLCTTCVDVCPSHLPVDRAIEKVRIEIAKQYGIAWYKKIYFYLLRHRKVMDFVFSFMAFIAPCAFKGQGDKGGKIRFFSNRFVFPFQKKSFLQLYQGEILAKKHAKNPNNLQNIESVQNLAQNLTKSKDSQKQDSKAQNLTHNKVAIFIGCLANYNYINVGKSLLKILDFLGIDVLIPKQECCGAPAYFTGDIKSVLVLIKKNIVYFEGFINDVDVILIPEATCAAMLMHDWKHALSKDDNSDVWIKRLESLLPKMQMASAWLYNHTNLMQILPKDKIENLSITYHDPCHAKKVLKIHKELRAILAQNFNIIEMSEADRCCGFGGVSMQADRYRLTLKAGATKAQMITQTRANIVSAECSACRMQITNALHQIKSNTEFKHPLELIASVLT